MIDPMASETAVRIASSAQGQVSIRDAFSSFINGDIVAARSNRQAFKQIWGSAIPIYAHNSPVGRELPTPQLPEVPHSPLPAGVIEALEAWQVSTRH